MASRTVEIKIRGEDGKWEVVPGSAAVDISLHLANLCDALGLEKDFVFRMEIEPAEVRALVYSKRDGRKYVDPETGDVAMAYLTFKVRT